MKASLYTKRLKKGFVYRPRRHKPLADVPVRYTYTPLYTLPGQISSPGTSEWSKATLNTGGVGGTVAGPPTCKTKKFLSPYH